MKGWAASFTGRRLLLIGAAATCSGARVAFADDGCLAGRPLAGDSARASWQAPLDRHVTIRLGEVTLRTGLDRLAAAAGIRLSYAPEFLPLERRVCATFVDVSAGAALVELLQGTVVEPMVVSKDQIVLAPMRRPIVESRPLPLATTPRPPSLLRSIVVNGSADKDDVGTQALPVTVITGKQLVARGGSSLAQALDGIVPGFWMWSQSPATPLARFASIRGASSFGATFPKVYVDGIQIANPQLVSRLNAETIERIEILRGPQGAALYGADAIAGVINISTRHESTENGAPRVAMRSETGIANSDFAASAVMSRDFWLAARAGSNFRSAGLNLWASTLGDFIPGAASRQFLASGDARIVGRRTTLMATARLFDWTAGIAESPLFSAIGMPEVGCATPDAGRITSSDGHGAISDSRNTVCASRIPHADVQTAREYTLGATLSAMPNDTWTHALVAGIDGYRTAGLGSAALPSESRDAGVDGGAIRATVHGTSVARFGGDAYSGQLSFALEHSVLREDPGIEAGPALFGPVAAPLAVAWRSSTGAVVQSNLTVAGGLSLTGGLRLEHNDGYTTFERTAALPLVSAAYVVGAGDVALKLRSSYGKAIRPPRSTLLRALSPLRAHVLGAAADLQPEEQAGVDWGADLSLGRALTVRATRFDQLASGLIQAVAVGFGGPAGPGHGLHYQWQNVGNVANRGWELETSARAGRLTLTGTLSLVESRVQRLTGGYTGELEVGDRMLEVPRRIAGLTAAWASPGWSASTTLARASDWVGYDQLGIAQALVAADSLGIRPGSDFLRRFWTHYAGVTRWRATASRDLSRGFALTLTGDNLLGNQQGEPDNVTILPGRTLLLGLRARF